MAADPGVQDARAADQVVYDSKDQEMSDSKEDDSESKNNATEFDWFQAAEVQGCNDAVMSEPS
jgi:hypothetical protein